MAANAENTALEEQKEKWRQLQQELKQSLITQDQFDWIFPEDAASTGSPRPILRLIGGVDISFIKGNDVDACACLVVLNFPELEVVYEDCEMVKLTLPYISGFLGFRESPFLLALLNKLRDRHPELIPQVIMLDGNGVLHPLGFGTACHFGVIADIPTLGVAKTFLFVDGLGVKEVKRLAAENCHKAGDAVPLVGQSGTVWGAAFRSTDETTNPVFVSQGHRLSLETALRLVRLTCRYRVPEPVRQADLRSREYLRVHAINEATIKR